MKRLLGVSLFLSLLLVAIAYFPELWFRSPVVERVLSIVVKKSDFTAGWMDLKTGVTRIDWKTFRFGISLNDLTFQSGNKSFKGTVKKLDLETEVSLAAFPPKILRLNRLHLHIPDFSYENEIQPSDEPGVAWAMPNLDVIAAIPSAVKELSIDLLEINIENMLISGTEFELKGHIEKKSKHAQISLIEKNRTHEMEIKVPITENERRLLYDRLDFRARSKIPSLGWLTARVRPRDACAEGRTCFEGQAALDPFIRNRPSAKIRFSTSLNASAADLNIDFAVLKIHPWLKKLSTRRNCLITADGLNTASAKIKFDCPFRADLRIPPIVSIPSLRFPTQTDLQVAMNSKVNPNDNRRTYQGELTFESYPTLAPLVDSALNLKSQFQGRLNDGSVMNGFHHRTDLRVKINVPRLEKLITSLHDTAWAIPAPLNNLNGALALTLDSKWEDWATSAPFTFTSQLESNEQALQTEASGKVTFQLLPKLSTNVEADWVLKKVRLSAPRLNPNEIPRFFPDSKILSRSDQKENRRKAVEQKESTLKYDLYVHSAEDSPVQIDSNLVKGPLLLDVQCRLSSTEALSGNMNILPIEFEAFRKTAVLERMQINFPGEGIVPGVDGVARIPAGTYVIYTHVSGPSDQVRIRLSSSPPVPEDEIWAILLFGQPMDSLDLDQQDSAQSTERALSRGGMGILSLYAFATTPIERVDYDPVSQRVAVRFRLTQKTSLEIGHSEEEVGTLGLVKRLGKGWILNTKVSSNESDGAGHAAGAGASLEWSSRY